MKKTRIVSIALLLSVCIFIFGGCIGDSKPLPDGEGGSDIAVTTDKPTVSETETKSPYSREDKLIALTYDDGPNPTHTNRILDILEKYNSHATFFVVGYNIENNVETIKRAQSIGCEIGNHSDSHKNLTKCTSSELRSQVDRPNELLLSLTGKKTALFRAPGGAFDGVTDDIGMPLIQWSVDTEDWKSKDASHKDRTAEERDAELRRIADEVVSNAKKGDIVLMHDIYGFTADLSELIVSGLVEKGFKLVTVSEMYKSYGVPLKNGEVYRSVMFTETQTESSAILEAGKYTVKTNGGSLNIRIEPKNDSQSIAKLSNGDTITVIKSVPGWAFVNAVSASGWVNAAYLVK